MILTAHQPQYFGGYCGYIKKILDSDVFIIMNDVEYSSGDFINRNRIRGKNGEIWLTVPVLHKGNSHAKIKDIEIDNTKNWKKKHIKTIEQCYSKAPHFQTYIQPLRDIYAYEWHKLDDFNMFCLATVLKELKIDTPIVKQSDYHFEGEKSDLILDFCLELGADWFIFGKNGRDYADIDKFSANGIEVEFQNYVSISYKQCYNGFIENLSCLDLLFNCGPDLNVIRGKHG